MKKYFLILLLYNAVITPSTYYNRLMTAYEKSTEPFITLAAKRQERFQQEHEAAVKEQNTLSPQQLEILAVTKEYVTYMVDRKIGLYRSHIEAICRNGIDGTSFNPVPGLAHLIMQEVESRREAEILRVSLHMLQHKAWFCPVDYRLYERFHYLEDLRSDVHEPFAVMHPSEFIKNIVDTNDAYAVHIKDQLEQHKAFIERRPR